MELIACLSSLLCCILLFFYHRLKREIRSLHKQLQYQNDTSGTFRNFSTINDRDLQLLRKEIEHLHELHREDQLNSIRSKQQLKELFTNISHDIRTPLTSIRGYLQLLEECENEKERERYLTIMQEKFAYLKELLEELFLYTKVSHPEFEVQKEQVLPCEMLSKVLMSMYEEFDHRNISMDVCYETESIMISSDAYLMERVYMNLLSNMLKYGKTSGQIHQYTKDQWVYIEFSNDVEQQLSKLEVSQLFERFSVLNSTASSNTSGLGLAIVKTIMEKLQGSVIATCDDHQLTISILIPID